MVMQWFVEIYVFIFREMEPHCGEPVCQRLGDSALTVLNAGDSELTILNAGDSALTILNAGDSELTILNAGDSALTVLNAKSQDIAVSTSERSLKIWQSPS
jgi:hypothetical protein